MRYSFEVFFLLEEGVWIGDFFEGLFVWERGWVFREWLKNVWVRGVGCVCVWNRVERGILFVVVIVACFVEMWECAVYELWIEWGFWIFLKYAELQINVICAGKLFGNNCDCIVCELFKFTIFNVANIMVSEQSLHFFFVKNTVNIKI